MVYWLKFKRVDEICQTMYLNLIRGGGGVREELLPLWWCLSLAKFQKVFSSARITIKFAGNVSLFIALLKQMLVFSLNKYKKLANFENFEKPIFD